MIEPLPTAARAWLQAGRAIASRMARTTMAIIASIRVNPLLLDPLPLDPLLLDPLLLDLLLLNRLLLNPLLSNPLLRFITCSAPWKTRTGSRNRPGRSVGDQPRAG
ncbi:hypothetical protein GCM10027432_29100 [Lysobacter fragariae]